MARTSTGLVLFGGETGSNILNETLKWNGVTWSFGTPTTVPPARTRHTMAFDPITGSTLMYGGQGTTGALADVWRWTGSNWVAAPPPSGAPVLDPQLVLADHRPWLVGREGPVPGIQRVEEWNGVSWQSRLRRELPPNRHSQNWSYDEVRGEIVVFGGRQPWPATAELGDTWTYGSAWVRHSPAQAPPPRAEGAMAFDRARGVTVLFGGVASGHPTDTWTWNGSNWTQHQPTSFPPPRRYSTLAYHPGRGTVFLHGGLPFGLGVLGDTWEWDGVSWSPVVMTGPNSGWPTLAYDDARNVMALYLNPPSGPASVWEFQGGTWVAIGYAPGGGGFAYDPTVGALCVFDGSYRHTYSGGQWLAYVSATPGPIVPDVVRGQMLSLEGGFVNADCVVMKSSNHPAVFEVYGAGCGPIRPITLGCSERPQPGSTPTFHVACQAANAAAWVFFGLQQLMAPLGNGCTAYLDVVVTHVLGTASAEGWAMFPMTVPNAASLIGVELFAEAVVAQPAGIGFSNGLRLRIGW